MFNQAWRRQRDLKCHATYSSRARGSSFHPFSNQLGQNRRRKWESCFIEVAKVNKISNWKSNGFPAMKYSTAIGIFIHWIQLISLWITVNPFIVSFQGLSKNLLVIIRSKMLFLAKAAEKGNIWSNKMERNSSQKVVLQM